MTDVDPYAEIAPFYDLEFDSFDADVDLYRGYAQMVGGPVLELGCGTGRLLIPLAQNGFEAYGLDNSPAMIDLATDRVRQHGLSDSIHLGVGDMRDLSAFHPDQFRLVFSAINSFLHLPERADQLDALRAIRGVLDRDGLLVLDVVHPTPDALLRMDDRYAFDAEWTSDAGEQVQRFSQRHVDVASQTIHTTLIYDILGQDGTVRRYTTSYDTRYVHRFELESLLAETGFELEGVYGSYALDPLERDSDQMIFVAHRTANPGEDDAHPDQCEPPPLL